MPNLPIDVYLIAIQIMPRSSSNWDGYTISKAIASQARSKRLSTLRNRSTQMPMMRKAGIFWADATCHNRNTPRRTRPISKRYIATVGTRHSGARLASCITRSISTEMRLMRTPGRYASIPTSPRSGTTLELCMSPATTKSMMHWMRTSVLPSSIPQTFISKLGSSYSETDRVAECLR